MTFSQQSPQIKMEGHKCAKNNRKRDLMLTGIYVHKILAVKHRSVRGMKTGHDLFGLNLMISLGAALVIFAL